VSTPQPCLRCGECAAVCPSGLQPQLKLILAALRREDPGQAQALGLEHCHGCAGCDARCPSAIPLAALFESARRELQQTRQREAYALASRERFVRREARLAREREDQAAERERQRAANASADAVAAALARARARPRPTPPGAA